MKKTGAILKDKQQTRSVTKKQINLNNSFEQDTRTSLENRTRIVHSPKNTSFGTQPNIPIPNIQNFVEQSDASPTELIRDFNIESDSIEPADPLPKSIIDSNQLNGQQHLAGAVNSCIVNDVSNFRTQSKVPLETYVQNCVRNSLNSFETSMMLSLESMLKSNIEKTVKNTVLGIMNADKNKQKVTHSSIQEGQSAPVLPKRKHVPPPIIHQNEYIPPSATQRTRLQNKSPTKNVYQQFRDEVESESCPGQDEDDARSLLDYSSSHPNRKIELDRWGICFDGTSKSISAEDFVFRVEILKRNYNLSWPDIIKNFHLLLGGIAQNWFWQFLRTNPRSDWRTIRKALLKQFKTYESDFEIIKQIMERRQQNMESFDEYYNAIMHLRNQLRQPIPETELLQILKGNVNNRLMSFVYPMAIYSLENFREECRRTEKMLQARDLNRHRQNPFMYKNVHEIDWKNPLDDVSFEVDALSFDKRCYNCKKQGHSFVSCPLPSRNLFCYRCGLDNFTTPDCPKCNPQSGNRRSSVKKTGESRSTQTSPYGNL